MTRKPLLTLIFVIALIAHGYAQKPNVFLFTVDSCRADRFGTYGYSKDTTPQIDEWAREGAVFTRAYSNSAWTVPGLVSTLTGLYPPTHGVNNRDNMGSPKLATLIKILEKEGYEVPSLNFFTFAPYYVNLGLKEVQREYFDQNEESPLLNWIKREVSPDREKPFFLWFHTTIVHQPYNPSEEVLPDTRENLEKSPGIRAVLNGAIVPIGSTEFVPEDKPILDLLYDEEIKRIDRLFGDAIDLLREAQQLDNTLIMLTADHGEELLDHGFVGHASTALQAKLYEELIHIPLIVSMPGQIEGGSIVTNPVSQVDIAPTVLRLLEFPVPESMQGMDLFSSPHDRPIYLESVIAGNQTPRDREDDWLRGLLQGRYKYISNGELYDLQLDPAEQNNLVEKFPELASTMESQLKKWTESSQKLHEELFPESSRAVREGEPGRCPRIYTPQNGHTLQYDVHTGALLFDWRGDMETTYLIQYDIGTGDHHVEGVYEVDGNHQILGPFPPELWENLKAWNPFKIRVSPKGTECWSDWVEFYF